MAVQTVIIREGRVEYVDLCRHTNVSREEFFESCGLKKIVDYGLILEMDDVVKVLNSDDQEDNEECEGIVIPRSCVVSITYWGDDDNLDPKSSEVN